MKATLKNHRQSARKVRLIADLVRGKKVEDAIVTLEFTAKRAARPVKKLLESALANARNNSGVAQELVIKEIMVDEGPTMKRFRMRARGSVSMIRKRTSHVKVVLGATDGSEITVETPAVEEKAEKKETKKAEPKKKSTAKKSTTTKTTKKSAAKKDSTKKPAAKKVTPKTKAKKADK